MGNSRGYSDATPVRSLPCIHSKTIHSNSCLIRTGGTRHPPDRLNDPDWQYYYHLLIVSTLALPNGLSLPSDYRANDCLAVSSFSYKPTSQSHTVDIPQELKDSIRKFRFTRHRGNAALVVKINKQKLIMEQVDRFDDISLEELAEGTVAQGCSDFGSRLI